MTMCGDEPWRLAPCRSIAANWRASCAPCEPPSLNNRKPQPFVAGRAMRYGLGVKFAPPKIGAGKSAFGIRH